MKHIIVRDAIPKEICNYLAIEYRMIRDNVLRTGGAPWDPTVPGAFAMYSPICFEALNVYLQPKIEEVLGKELYSSYSYARIYKNGCELKRHKDRQSSEYAVSACITKDVDWPLYFEYEDSVVPVELEVGDIVVFQGHKYFHWRRPYNGDEQIMGFLQYVDKNGDWKHYKYDGRPMMGAPFETAHPDIHEEMKTLNDGYIDCDMEDGEQWKIYL